MSNDDVVIRVAGLWKRYGLPLPGVYYKGRRWLRSLRNSHNPQSAIHNPQSDDGPWALRDLNLEVHRGETLGIIGRNGAGKSTLLKVLAGVTPPTRGKVDVRGRIFPMIELNAGIHPELTGRENVYLLGAVMGLTRQEMTARMPEIEEFCELGEWFDRPVWKYSSGMLARLGFGVAMNVDAEILLIDEVLAVGDVRFQNRCLGRMKEQRDAGKTIVFVSHVMDMVQYLCQRVVFLADGSVVGEGDPERLITQYENAMYRSEAQYNSALRNATTSFSAEKFELRGAAVYNGRTGATNSYSPEDGFIIDFHCESMVPLDRLIFSFGLLNHRRENCIWEYLEGQDLRPTVPSGHFTLRLTIPPVPLSGGVYTVNFMVRDARSLEKLCHYKGILPFVLTAHRRERGVLTVPVHWECIAINQKESQDVAG